MGPQRRRKAGANITAQAGKKENVKTGTPKEWARPGECLVYCKKKKKRDQEEKEDNAQRGIQKRRYTRTFKTARSEPKKNKSTSSTLKNEGAPILQKQPGHPDNKVIVEKGGGEGL